MRNGTKILCVWLGVVGVDGAAIVGCNDGGLLGSTVIADASVESSIDGAAEASVIDGRAGAPVTLSVPVGAYTGCVATTVVVAQVDGGLPGLPVVGVRTVNASGGGSGTVNLSTSGDGGVATVLAFEPWVSGTVTFTPTSSTTAASSAGPFDIEAEETWIESQAVDTIPGVASVLALVDDTLLISVYGQATGTSFSAYCRCPVPASLPLATIVNPAPAKGAIPTGTYEACNLSLSPTSPTSPGSGSSGGDMSLTITESGEMLTATQDGGYPAVCGLAFDDISGSTATVSDGKTCTIQEPCGPPPTMGTTSAPSEVALTNMAGSIEAAGGVLFINVIGDAPSVACGSHTLSLICPTAP
jgi:hypothetical protein